MTQRVLLCIMDGFGKAPASDENAVYLAKTPNIDNVEKTCPNTILHAEGEYVGLPEGQMGNSEVGHLNLGAGRVVYQELTRITKSIQDGDFFENEALCNAINKSVKDGTFLHLMGLMSDGGVHSHNSHLWGLLKMAKAEGLEEVYIHCFLEYV